MGKNSELKNRHGYDLASSAGLFDMSIQGPQTARRSLKPFKWNAPIAVEIHSLLAPYIFYFIYKKTVSKLEDYSSLSTVGGDFTCSIDFDEVYPTNLLDLRKHTRLHILYLFLFLE
ncbi:hypothetical protein FG384_06435 [Psychrobacillus vulpis]|uniref:Uncharacterized protein n=1 Tax=Psychrobacillus vulpis TaxID=2325572 RepID=A0A544TTF3_9BACI|nr:hypothetical protein FG384_06435 [Psychrobacillus vulpis]